MTSLRESASQTAGPYVHIGLLPNTAGLAMYGGADLGATMRADGVRGEAISVTGRVLDGLGATVRDALVEVWQADADGHLPSRDPAFAGWGRSGCDETGLFRFETVKPGRVGPQAPHLTLWIAARGIGLALHTRLYFTGDPANDADPVLARIDPPMRRETLLARAVKGGWHMDVRLQGEGETVFFDV